MSRMIFFPPGELRLYINQYMFIDILLSKSVEDVFCTFPNGGCIMNIFYSSDLPVFIFPGKEISNLRSFVSGYLKHGVKLGRSGHYKCVIIKFTPLGAYHLFGIPPSKYINSFVNAEDLLGRSATKLIEYVNLAISTFRSPDLYFYNYHQMSQK